MDALSGSSNNLALVSNYMLREMVLEFHARLGGLHDLNTRHDQLLDEFHKELLPIWDAVLEHRRQFGLYAGDDFLQLEDTAGATILSNGSPELCVPLGLTTLFSMLGLLAKGYVGDCDEFLAYFDNYKILERVYCGGHGDHENTVRLLGNGGLKGICVYEWVNADTWRLHSTGFKP